MFSNLSVLKTYMCLTCILAILYCFHSILQKLIWQASCKMPMELKDKEKLTLKA